MNQGVKPTQKQILSARKRRSERQHDEMAGKWIPSRFNGSWMMTWKDMWPFIAAFIVSVLLTIIFT